MNIIQETVEKILIKYTRDDHYEDLKKAKDAYMAKTGRIDEEIDEYESRMNSFNDWYLFNYKKEDGSRIIEDYLASTELEENLRNALISTNFSLFLFQKVSFRKQIVLKDILHSKKLILAEDNGILALVEDDLFLGRMVTYNEQSYLLNGICTLPTEIYSTLKKESKKIRKLNNMEEEEIFLLNLERLKTRSLQYGHIESSKIFTF